MQAPCASRHLSPSEMAAAAIRPKILNVPDHLRLEPDGAGASPTAGGAVDDDFATGVIARIGDPKIVAGPLQQLAKTVLKDRRPKCGFTAKPPSLTCNAQ